jgi:hypothetical protein
LVVRLPQKLALKEDNRLSLKIEGGGRIVSLPSGESTVRGFSGVSLIVEDEAARVPDDLYKAIRPMLAISGGQLVLMSTPFGKRGHFFEEWQNGGAGWERVRVPATDCPRIPPAFLAAERSSLGDWWFRQEYGCEFSESSDQVFGYDVVRRAFTNEVGVLFDDQTPVMTEVSSAPQPLFGGSP